MPLNILSATSADFPPSSVAFASALVAFQAMSPSAVVSEFQWTGNRCPAILPIASRWSFVVARSNVTTAQSIPFVKRSEEHTAELQSRGLIAYALFCLKKKDH